MKLAVLSFLSFAFVMANAHGIRNLAGACTDEYPCDECEPRDCDSDSQCAGDLLCADEHEDELQAKGYSRRRANCGSETAPGVEVCFHPDLLKLGYCEGDCDNDSDCKTGLLCADMYKEQLIALGCPRRKANCDVEGDGKTEFCFDPAEAFMGC